MSAAGFLSDGGEAGALMRRLDWSRSPLGEPEGWPQSLRSVVGLLLTSKFPMFVAWGPELGFVYNDPYAEILGAKHPSAMGARFADIWAEIWPDIEPLIERALSGEATYHQDLPLLMRRKGYDEQTWFTFSYSPVRDESGAVAGIYCACTETTEKVLAERRLTAQHKRLSQMFDQAPGFMAIVRGPDHVFELTNAAYMQLIGHRDVIGRPAREALPEIEGQGFFELLDRVYATGEAFVGQAMAVGLQRTPGAAIEQRFVDLVYQPVTDAAGAATGIFAEGYDVTERVLAEAELRANAARQEFRLALEERLRGLAEPDEIIAAASEALGRHLGAGQVAYAVIDAAMENVTVEYQWNDGTIPAVGAHHRFKNYGAFADDLRIGRTVAIGDVRLDPRTSSPEALASFANISVAGFINAPVLKEGRLLAMLAVHSLSPRTWSAEEVALADDIAERTWAAAERARAAAGLRESEERLRRIVEGVKDHCVFTVDTGGIVTDWAPGAEAIFGWAAEEIVGQSGDLLFTPEDRAAGVSDRELAHAREKGCANDQRWHVRKDGSRFFANGSVRPLHDAAGAITGFIKIARDETERRATEHALHESEERYRSLFNSIDAGFCIIEMKFDDAGRAADYRFLEVNPAFESQTGLKDAAGKWVRAELVPDLEQHWFDAYGAVARTGEPARFEDRAGPMGGRWFDVHAFPIGERDAYRVAILFNDISDRRRVEEALRESEARLRAITDNLPSGMVYQIATGPEGQERRFLYVSRSHERLTGIPAEAVLANPSIPYDLILPEHREAMMEAEAAAIRDKRPFDVQARFRRADGEVRWCRIISAPREQPDGSLIWDGIQIDITGQKSAEEALRLKGEEFYALADNMPALCWMAHADGHIFWYNRRWYEYTGTGAREMEGWGWQSVHDPEALPEVTERWRLSLASGEPFEMTFPLKGADGAFRPFLTRVVPIFDESGQLVRWFGTNVDISEQRQIEEALRKSEAAAEAIAAEQAAILGQLAEGVIVADPAGRIVFVNEAAERLHGVERLDVAPDAYSETYSLFTESGEPYPSNALPLARAVLRGESVHDERWRIRRPDGSEVLAIGTALPMRRPDGAQGGAILTLRDDTARHAAELAVRELNATLEERVAQRTAERDRAWRLSQDLLAVAEQDGTFAAVNAAWSELLGWEADELVGFPFAVFTHPDDLQATLTAFAGIIEAPLTVPFEYRLRHKDGSYRWFAWTAAFEGGRIYANGRHTTPEHEQAEALAQAQEALRQSQKLEAMGQLTGGVAHDFNNLLTPIVGSLDLLHRRGLGGERERRLIDGALQSAERAKTLVQRLLAFARRQPLQTSAVDISVLVSGMAELVASTSGPQVKIVTDVAADLPAAVADPNQLEMAILNLAVNARDAMPDGGTLTIAARRERIEPGHRSKLKPADYIKLSVSDTGTGMDEATIARAVEPFFSTKGIGKGTGLGLSMVHGLASQLGGALGISSKLGLGTSVMLWLPISETPAERPEKQADLAPEANAIGTALLVDDEELVRTSTADMLADIGYEVVEAASAEEALQILERGTRIDLLVTDHLMPGMTGTDLARTFKEKRPGKPVLLVSGYAEAEGMAPDLVRLTKPFRQADLAASLASLSSA